MGVLARENWSQIAKKVAAARWATQAPHVEED